jgi:hypothetical protein
VLAGCIVVAGTAGFWLLLSQMERTRTAELSLALKDRQALVARSILRGVERTAEVASRPNILRIYSEPSEDSDDADHAAMLAAVARVMTRSEFSAFAFLDADGREIARAGEFFETSDLHIPLNQASGGHQGSAALGWRLRAAGSRGHPQGRRSTGRSPRPASTRGPAGLDDGRRPI